MAEDKNTASTPSKDAGENIVIPISLSSTTLIPDLNPIETDILKSKHTFFTSTELKTFPPSSRFGALDWQREQNGFFAALEEALLSGKNQAMELTELWKSLCKQYGDRPLDDWILFWKRLHARCEVLFVVNVPTSANLVAKQENALRNACMQSLPPVMPMFWQVERCKDAPEADACPA